MEVMRHPAPGADRKDRRVLLPSCFLSSILSPTQFGILTGLPTTLVLKYLFVIQYLS